MSETNELRIFISSTFRDMQNEREHLVKKVFPEIRALCRERGLTFTDVDLRWGITPEEVEREGIIRLCLEEIDRCRPWFIGILGERYGWTPPSSEVRQVEHEFPRLSPPDPGTSITEMEMVYGVLDNPEMAGRALFYTRATDATPPDGRDLEDGPRQRLADLKQRIQRSPFPLREGFGTPEELGEWIREDMVAILDRDHPVEETPDELTLMRRSHAAFARSRTRAYIPDTTLLEILYPALLSPGKPILLLGESGLGKSSTTAWVTHRFRREHPSAVVIEHYVGAADRSGSATGVMRHVIDEIRKAWSIDDEIPSSREELERRFPNWLSRAAAAAREDRTEILIVIDALNQLGEYGRLLTWLPEHLPDGIRMLLTTTPGDVEQELLRRDLRVVRMTPVETLERRRDIVLNYLGSFRKSLSGDQIDRVVADPHASKPIFLRLIAEELRLWGEHETLDEAIDRLLGAPTLPDLFERILERLEGDFGRELVTTILRTIAASRTGLTEAELIAITRRTRLELSRLLFALDYHLVRRDGRLDFFHAYLGEAIDRRYLGSPEGEAEAHRGIIEYFEKKRTNLQGVSTRDAWELAYQYDVADREADLYSLCSSIPHLRALYESDAKYDLLRYWKRLRDRGFDPAEGFSGGLDRFEQEVADTRSRIDACMVVHQLLDSFSMWPEAIEVLHRAEGYLEPEGMIEERAEIERTIGVLLSHLGEMEESLQRLRKSLALARESGDPASLAESMLFLGNTLMACSEYDEALDLFAEAEKLFEGIEDIPKMLRVRGNMGIAYSDRGDLDQAILCFDELERECRRRGDIAGVGNSLLNRGTVYSDRFDLRRSRDCYEEALKIFEDLGDPFGIGIALGNLAPTYEQLEEVDRARQCYAQHIELAHRIGSIDSLASTLGNLAGLHAHIGEYQQAFDLYAEALVLAADVDDRRLGRRGTLRER